MEVGLSGNVQRRRNGERQEERRKLDLRMDLWDLSLNTLQKASKNLGLREKIQAKIKK